MKVRAGEGRDGVKDEELDAEGLKRQREKERKERR